MEETLFLFSFLLYLEVPGERGWWGELKELEVGGGQGGVRKYLVFGWHPQGLGRG